MQMQRKVLAFDGGPSPMVSLRILRKMELAHPGFLEKVDLFAGTSHGGLVALDLAVSLTKGSSGIDAINSCINFDDEIMRTFKVGPRNWLRLASGLKSLSDAKDLEKLLMKRYSNPETGKLLKMCDLKKQVTLVGFDAAHRELTTYHSFEPGGCKNMPLVEAALACGSFPVFLPYYRGARSEEGRGDDLILDAGFGVNSVAMPALSDALLNLNYINDEARMGDLLPYLTLLSMGSRSDDKEAKIPVLDLLLKTFERFGLAGPSRRLQEGGSLHEAGWLWVLQRNVTALLTLFENTESIDERYARNLLDYKRYYRVAPRLPLLRLLWLILTRPEEARRLAEDLAKKFWEDDSLQSKDLYARWKQYSDKDIRENGERVRRNPEIHTLKPWVDWYWMQELNPAYTASHPPVSLDWNIYRLELRSATLDPSKNLASFEHSDRPKELVDQVLELGKLAFIQDGQNVFIVGPSGSGKSFLAQALGNQAYLKGYNVVFLPMWLMLRELAQASSDTDAYKKKVAEYAMVELLILDDFLLKPMDVHEQGHLFDVLDERSNRQLPSTGKRLPLILTSPQPPPSWHDSLGKTPLATAVIRRLDLTDSHAIRLP